MSAAIALALLSSGAPSDGPCYASAEGHLSDSESEQESSECEVESEEDNSNNNVPYGLFGKEGADGRGSANNHPGIHPATMASKTKYHTKFCRAWEKIAQLEGTKVKVGKNLNKITWQVVAFVTQDKIVPESFCGAKNPDFYTNLLINAFMYLWPGNFHKQHEYIVR